MLKGRTLSGTIALAAIWLLTACGAPAPVAMPEISFSAEPVVTLNAEGPIEVVDQYRAPLTHPNVEHVYRIAPGQLARSWVKSRVGLTGNGGDARLTIHDAGVRRDEVEVRGGLLKGFGTANRRRLTATLDVTLDFVGVGGGAASTRVKVAVERILDKGLSDREKEIVYFELLEELATAFDAEMTRRIKEEYRPVFRQAA